MIDVSKNVSGIQSLGQLTNQLLTELIHQLNIQGLWQKNKPNLCELSSTAPFCCDTLTFEQWLQFIFIPKIQTMIIQGEALPTKIALTPMAEESFKHLGSASEKLIHVLTKIDQLLCAPR
jgi:uncharacterized protein YqcC (DUF446 family)